MINLVFDPFDSGLWGKKVCRLYLDGPFDEGELKTAFASERPDIVYAFSPFSPVVTEQLNGAGFLLVSIRSTYVLPNDATITTRDLPEGVRIVPLAGGFTASDEDICEMAAAIGPTSRYFNDPRIPSEDAMRFYVAWIRNSLVNGYANEAFMAIHHGRLVGLITVKIKEGRDVIDLLGVVPSFRRVGLGGALLAEAVNFFRSTGIRDIAVVTEGENVRANAFYQRNGFISSDLMLVSHAHPIYG